MNLVIKKISDKKIWEDFILSCPFYTFLTSWSWGEVERELGSEIFRWGIYEENQLVGLLLVIKIKAKRGTFAYLPHNPLFKNEKNLDSKLKFIINYLKTFGRKENLNFIRIGSLFNSDKEVIFKNLGLIKAPTHIYTDNFLVLDLNKSEEELLMNMRKTTRNLIRRAEREGARISQTTEISKIKDFYQLLKQTSQRHSFVAYSQKMLETELKELVKDNQIALFEGDYQEKLLAGAMIVFYGKSAFYHHGASIISKIPVSYLLQWEAIKEAKKRGCRKYNFWGFAPGDNPRHPFYGITIFKKGFGGAEINCCANYDLMISKKYWLSYIIETIRRIRRGH